MRWRTWLPAVVFLPLIACLDTDLTIRADGSVAGTVTWLSAPDLSEAVARAWLTGEGVTISKIELKDTETPPAKPGGTSGKARRVTAAVEAKSAEALTAVPLFKALKVSATLGKPEAGKRTLTVQVAPDKQLRSGRQTDNVIRLHLPGPVSQTSGKAAGHDVTWTITATELETKPEAKLSVVYAEEPATPAGK